MIYTALTNACDCLISKVENDQYFYKVEQYFTKEESILIHLFSKWILPVYGNIRACGVFLIKLYIIATLIPF